MKNKSLENLDGKFRQYLLYAMDIVENLLTRALNTVWYAVSYVII